MVQHKQYDHFGVMLDCSRNAVRKPSEIKKFIDLLQKMGYDTLELYTEDTYEVEGEPYFGYLRGRFTDAELREIDEYAKSKGVELIPCVQTLAHYTAMIRWRHVYDDIFDCNDILLAEEEKTYQLIDRIFATLAKNFTSRRVNIGMDEAHMLGLGKYLDKHGYQNRFDIILKHLQRVTEIAQKYGFTPHMWSDMFFRLISNGQYNLSGGPIPQEVRDALPKGVELTYWNYYSSDEETYDKMFSAHEEFNTRVWYAGGAWTWNGFAPLNKWTLTSMKASMKQVSAHDVKDVLITMWGDDGSECSMYSTLPALYAVRRFADGEYDQTTIEKEFKELFGMDFSDFMLLDLANRTTKNLEGRFCQAQCKRFLFNDPFLGISDCMVKDEGFTPYGEYALSLMQAAEKVGEYGYVFRTQGKLCSLLQVKKDLGIHIREAYDQKDKKKLKEAIKEIKIAQKRLEEFYLAFRTQWFKENKPFGWEVQDVRLGGLMTRLAHCQERLEAFVKGKIDVIEELEEKVMDDLPELWGYREYVEPGIL